MPAGGKRKCPTPFAVNRGKSGSASHRRLDKDIPSNYQGNQVVSRINANVNYYDTQSTWLSFFILVLYAYIWGFPGSTNDKESTCNAGDIGSIPGSERSPGKGMVTHSMPHTLTVQLSCSVVSNY